MKSARPKNDGHRFTSSLEQSHNKLWGCHFRVPTRIAKRLIDGNSRRVVCTLNDSAEYQCAMLPHGNGAFVISVNKQLRDKLGLSFGVEVHVRLANDKSVYGLPMPEEFHELLQQDVEGNSMFHALTRGKQRTLLYIIGSAKGSEKRVTRSIVIVKHLKANRGKINYGQLTLSLKDHRR
jgi:hypothetical protein